MATEKKAELTSKQLITIIILIISFSIIILFFFMFDFGGVIDEESCRNSVIMKGTFSSLGKINPISLKCKTKDICLSMGGDCGGFKDAKKIIVNENSLTKEIVNLIYRCWWMMGEGKVDYSSSGCAICYKLRFDEQIQNNENLKEGIKYSEIYDYMINNKISEDNENYLYKFYKLNSVDAVRNKISETNNLDINKEIIDFSEEYVIVDSIYDKKNNPPVLVKFTAESLNQFNCDEFVTEA